MNKQTLQVSREEFGTLRKLYKKERSSIESILYHYANQVELSPSSDHCSLFVMGFLVLPSALPFYQRGDCFYIDLNVICFQWLSPFSKYSIPSNFIALIY